MIQRGAIHWIDLGPARGSAPAKQAPVLVVQADAFNASRFNTTLAVVISSDTSLAGMPGNVFLPASATGLPKDSAVNVTALVTLAKAEIEGSNAVADLPDYLMEEGERGLRRVLSL